MVNLDGLALPINAGIGGFLGCLCIVPLAILGIWFPAIFGWLWVPPVVGTVGGMIVATFQTG